MKEKLLGILLVLLVAITAPIWIPIMLIYAGVHKDELDDIDF